MKSRIRRFSPRNHRYWDPMPKIITHDRISPFAHENCDERLDERDTDCCDYFP
jgi:hypothetical protein